MLKGTSENDFYENENHLRIINIHINPKNYVIRKLYTSNRISFLKDYIPQTILIVTNFVSFIYRSVDLIGKTFAIFP